MADEARTWVNKRLNPQMEWDEIEEWVDSKLNSVIDERNALWARMHRQTVEREELRRDYTDTGESYRKWSLQYHVYLRTRLSESKVWQKYARRAGNVSLMARLRIPRMPRRPVNDVLDRRLAEYEAQRNEMLGRLDEVWNKEPPHAPPYGVSGGHRRLSASEQPSSEVPGREGPDPFAPPPTYDGAFQQQPVTATSEVARTARATLPPHVASAHAASARTASSHGAVPSSPPPTYNQAVQGQSAVAAREHVAGAATEASPPRTPAPGSTARSQVSRPPSPSRSVGAQGASRPAKGL